MTNLFKLVELHRSHLPADDRVEALSGHLTAYPVGQDGHAGWLVAVPPKAPRADDLLTIELCQLLLWAREVHGADWLWFDPTTPALCEGLPVYP